MKEKKARVEDALHATRAAVEEGILPGGGVALLRAAGQVKPEGLSPRRAGGLQHRAPRLPCPADPDRRQRRPRRRHRLREGARGKGNFGYNAATDVYEDLVKAGVIDPTKVTRTALQNASSVATLLLTSDALIAEKPKKEEKAAGRPRRRSRTCTKRCCLLPANRWREGLPRWTRTSRRTQRPSSRCSSLGSGGFFNRSRTAVCLSRTLRGLSPFAPRKLRSFRGAKGDYDDP